MLGHLVDGARAEDVALENGSSGSPLTDSTVPSSPSVSRRPQTASQIGQVRCAVLICTPEIVER
jgi:hypothetical protein